MFRFGFDALHNGYLFMYVGILGAVIQGGLIGRLVKRFGEMKLVVTGTLLFAASLFSFPFAGPHIGLAALLIVGAIFAIGNSLSTPTLTALASKSVGRGEQGGVLGVTQSVASLARAVGPVIGGLLIYSAMDVLGADGQLHKMSDSSIKATFWTAAGIMFVGFLLSLYFAWAHSTEYQNEEAMSEARA
jgi:DHA1 family tetracycline resistance protein-like MFS transporter